MSLQSISRNEPTSDTFLSTCSEFVHQTPTFSDLASLLRACRTLSSPRLLAFTERELARIWSSDCSLVTPTKLDNAVEALVLGSTWGLPGILKRAYYDVLRMADPVTHVHALREADDGGGRASLTDKDIARLVRARWELREKWLIVCILRPALIEGPCPSPHADASCTKARQVSNTEWHRYLSNANVDDPICGCDSLVESNWLEIGFCDACVKKIQKYWKDMKAEIWESLDGWLGIGVGDGAPPNVQRSEPKDKPSEIVSTGGHSGGDPQREEAVREEKEVEQGLGTDDHLGGVDESKKNQATASSPLTDLEPKKSASDGSESESSVSLRTLYVSLS